MFRVIPEEGDKGRGEPAPDHQKGRQSCRRGDGIEGNHTRPGQIIRWAGSRNGHYPALLSSIARISPIFPAIPLIDPLVIANRHPPSHPHTSEASSIDRGDIADFHRFPP